MSINRRVVTVAAVAAAVVALTACEPDQVGAAATAGDARLSVSELQDQVVAVVEERNEAIQSHDLQLPTLDPGGDLAEVQQQELTRWINRRVYERAAENAQIEVYEADVDQFLEDISAQFPDGDITPLLAEQGFTEDSVRDEVRVALISEGLNRVGGDEAAVQEALQVAAQELDVEVNPRYGTWTADAGFSPGSGSVSVPVDGEARADGGLASE